MTEVLVGVVIVAVLIYFATEFFKNNNLPTNEEEWSDDVKEAAGDFE